MKKRQLFKAIDSNGRIILIDSIDKNTSIDGEGSTKDKSIYLCPYCKREVVPKMGEKNVWHFAHKENVCEYLNIKTADGLTDGKIDVNSFGSVSADEFIDSAQDSPDFLCIQCKKRFRKEQGLKWDSKEYICKGCFNSM